MIKIFLLFYLFLLSCNKNIPVLDSNYGYFINYNKTLFRIHSPNSNNVYLVIFDKYFDDAGIEYKMESTNSGDWEIELDSIGIGTYYGYRLEGPFNDPNVIVADPYSKSAVTQNSFRHVAKSLIIDESFDWENDSWLKVKMHDLVIYEAHVRDMTIDETSRAKNKGTYKGFIEPGQKGGIEHLKNFGVNAVQFLPLWDFANFEIPYQVDTAGFFNDWNPY